jgi:Uma2 family endonuclease
MATIAETSANFSQKAAFPPEPVCRFSIEQYEEMIRSGIIREDDPVELLDGWLVPKMTKNPPHVLASELVRDALQRVLPEGWCVYSQQPVRLPTSMPEPDATVIRGQRRQYRDQRLRADDVGLVVEVADSTLLRDQLFKKALYARAGIPVYWLVNLVEGRLEEYAEPASVGENADYRQRREYRVGDEIPLVLDGRRLATIPVRELLP